MKVVIQRVLNCSVEIAGKIKSETGKGILVLVGFEQEDNDKDIERISKKIINLRIFNDETGRMNLSIKDVQGEIMIVSQFTLHASTKKGNRPSYIKAAKPDIAIPLYNKFIEEIRKLISSEIKTGEFGADMKISLINDGPVTIIIDSKNPE